MSGRRHAWTVDDSAIYEQVGLRLQAARRRAGMTQQQVAAMVGLTRSSVANIERGWQGTGIPLFLSLCDALNVDPCQILGGGS
jgi:DNA-binding XRE family transcriptional regulator